MRTREASNPGPRSPVSGLCYVLTIAFFLVISPSFFGCEESFEPLQENEAFPFSIHGYLDAAADTQWIRVSPARDQIDMPPEIPEMTVTMEHLESGNTVIMNDSLFQLSQGFNAVNVWTEMDINTGESYRLEAERPDGATSSVTVTLPEMTPNLRFIESSFGSGTLFINDVEHLADVQSRWYILINEGRRVFSIPLRRRAERIAEREYRVLIDRNRELDQIQSQLLIDVEDENGVFFVLRREVFVASAGPEWIEDLDSMEDLIFALPEGLSNVENGLGYMVGIVSETIGI